MASVAVAPLVRALAAPLSGVALSQPMVRMRAKLKQIAKSEIPRIIAAASDRLVSTDCCIETIFEKWGARVMPKKGHTRKPILQNDGLQPRQLLQVQGALRPRRRTGPAGNQPQEAGIEEPRVAGDRGCHRNAGDRAAGLRSLPHCQR